MPSPHTMQYIAIASILIFFLFSLVAFHRTGAGALVQQNFDLSQDHNNTCVAPITPEPLKESIIEPTTKQWQFEVTRDAENYGLDADQCESAFPKLYVEIDKSVALRKNNSITLEELDSRWVIPGIIRVMIYNGQVR
jgi:hypothetical protein